LASDEATDPQLDLCADDLRRLVEIERGQRLLLENAYEDTVVALARALESKDSRTGAHSQRVQRYALELADAVAPELLGDASAEHGFLLHDVGKIGIPDRVLRKPGPLDPDERRLMETHTLMGERMLSDVALLRGEGLRVVRSHHERWDGWGYPDRLLGDEIPIGARVFAVADTLDALTNDRPYRAAGSWDDACKVIARRRAPSSIPTSSTPFSSASSPWVLCSTSSPVWPRSTDGAVWSEASGDAVRDGDRFQARHLLRAVGAHSRRSLSSNGRARVAPTPRPGAE
jgi:hypothetical protein